MDYDPSEATDLQCDWHFAEKKGGIDIGPNDAMGEIFKKTPYEALVRESIQNSLDAANGSGDPVVVDFKIRKIEKTNFPKLMGIRRHIEACTQYYQSASARRKFQPMINYITGIRKYMTCLEVSDRNTIGMEYEKGDHDKPFYAFVQSAGVTSKGSNTAGGSFGFGKAAYFNISKIKSVLVSTMTTEKKAYFEGVSILCTHELDGRKCEHSGHYSMKGDEPVSVKKNIPSLFRRNEPGTSFYMLGIDLDEEPQDEIFDQIRRAVLLHFWLSIYSGKLEVNIGDKYSIRKSNLGRQLSAAFPEEDDTKTKYRNPRPYYDAVANALQDKKHIMKERSISVLGNVKFYLLKSKTGNDCIPYMRSPMMYVNTKRNRTSYGFYGVLVCDDEKGNEILRMTENPAHNEWDANNVSDKADRAKAREGLVALNKWVTAIIQNTFITQGELGLTFGGLEDYLYLPSTLDDEIDDDMPLEGDEGSNTTPKGQTMTTDIEFGGIQKTKSMTALPGKVTVKKKKKTSPKANGESARGNSSKPRSSSGGGIPTGTKPSVPQGDDPKGREGMNAVPVDITYRSFATKGDTGYVHELVINVDHDIEDAQIVLTSVGEMSDDAINTTSADQGTVIDNTVADLHLMKGKNTIKVKLADDMRHAIKLDAYEIK